jgi:hypothetical protein
MNAVFKKLNFKDQKTVFVINAPASFKSETDEMKSLTTFKTSLPSSGEVPFFLGFVTKQNEVDDLAKKISNLMVDDGVVWFAYPKGSSKKYKCEFNRDNGWAELGRNGYEPVRMVAIDEDWSALRFSKAENVKTMTRKSAISETGKKRIAAPKKPTKK